MSNYHSQNVNVVLAKDTRLWADVERRAAKDGVSVEDLISVAVNQMVGTAVRAYLNDRVFMEAHYER